MGNMPLLIAMAVNIHTETLIKNNFHKNCQNYFKNIYNFTDYCSVIEWKTKYNNVILF